MGDRAEILQLLETADNFVKYGRNSTRARERARSRYERAAALASGIGDEELRARAVLRLDDLRRVEETGVDDADRDATADRDGGSVLLSELPEHARARVPPGQRVKRGWPVLHEGPVPRFDASSWRLKVWGEVESPFELGYPELKDLPRTEMRSDFHCVTGWSKLDNSWVGVQTRELLERAGPADDASHALVHAEYGYTANLPLAVLLEAESMLAWAHNGDDLAPKHGYPLRLVVPRLYAWKSVKWVRGVELLAADRRGFWEVRGYHNRADPWLEERYSYQEA